MLWLSVEVDGNFHVFSVFLLHVSPDAGGMWSTAGCHVVTSLPDSTACFCNHTTNFAVLLQVYEMQVSEEPVSAGLWGGCQNCEQSVVNLGGFVSSVVSWLEQRTTKEEPTLQTLTFIGCGVSFCALIVTFILFLAVG